MFKTTTPKYQGVPGTAQPRLSTASTPNLCDRIAGLFTTPTPVYQDAPQPEPDPAPEPDPTPEPSAPQAQLRPRG